MTVGLPVPLQQYGYVVAQVIKAVADSPADPDDKPDAQGASGKIVFTPDVSQRAVVGDDGRLVIVQIEPFGFSLSGQGHLVDSSGRVGVWLLTGRWKVTYAVTGVTLPPADIEVTSGHTLTAPLSLFDAVPLPPPPQAIIQQISLPAGGTPGQVIGRGAGGLVWLDAVQSDTVSRLWSGPQTEYDAIPEHDPATLYIIQ